MEYHGSFVIGGVHEGILVGHAIEGVESIFPERGLREI